MIKKLLVVAFALALPMAAHAQDAAEEAKPIPPKPTKEEVLKVVQYQLSGKGGGPVLTVLTPCLEVDQKKGSATQWDCISPVDGPVKKNTTVSAWTQWLVPQDDKYDDLMIQFVHEGVVRSTTDLTLENPSYKARTFRSSKLTKPGKWELKVLRGSEELGSAVVTVVE